MTVTESPSLMPLLGDEKSIDLEDVRDEKKTELIELNAALMRPYQRLNSEEIVQACSAWHWLAVPAPELN